MNVFGIGPMELLLVLILALIFLGPEELPTVARRLGKLVRDLQTLSAQLSEQVQEELGPELEELSRASKELQEVGRKAREVRTVVQNPAQAVEYKVREAFAPPPPRRSEGEEATEEAPTSESPAPPRVSTRPLTPPADVSGDDSNREEA